MTDLLREALRDEAHNQTFFPSAILARARAMRRRRRGGRLVLAVVGVVAVVAVAATIFPPLDNRGEVHPATGGAGPLIALEEPLSTFPTGEVVGRLELRSGCLVVSGAVLVLANPDARWDAGEEAVVTPDGRVYPTGSMVRFGGGHMPLHNAIEAALGAQGADRARTCLLAVGADEIALADYSPVP